MKKVIIL